MKTTSQWVEQAIQQLGVTAYRLAKMMEADTSLVSAYRNGRQVISEGHAIKLGELMGIDPLPIVATAAYERSKTDQVKAFWARHAELAGVVAFVGLVGGTMLSAPTPVYAGQSPSPVDITGQDIHRGKYRRRRQRTSSDRWVRQITGLHPGFFSPSWSASHSHD